MYFHYGPILKNLRKSQKTWTLSNLDFMFYKLPIKFLGPPPAFCIAIGYAIGKEKENSIKEFLHLSEDFSPTSVRDSVQWV